MRIRSWSISLLLTVSFAWADDRPPTLQNVPYGNEPSQTLDFYKAESAKPTPVLFFIHGGGWMNGDKKGPNFLKDCLATGISVVSINYRLIPEAVAQGVNPPVKACLEDSARALQFVCSRAAEWNIDPHKVAVCGGSAGGFNALWLAFHPDLADPQSADPVARQSTRVTCALTFVPQTSLDPLQMRQWIPNIDYGPHAFSLPSYASFLTQRDKLMPWIKEYSPYELVTPDDPPVYLFYDSAVAPGQPAKDPPHSANFGEGLAEKLKAVGVEYEFNRPGVTGLKHPDLFSFITEKLQANRPAAAPAKVATDEPAQLFDLTGEISAIKTEHSAVKAADDQGIPALQADFESGVPYPNVEFPMSGERDLSAYKGVEVEISNLSSIEVKVVLRVDDAGDWQTEPSNSEMASLPAGTTQTIRVTFGQSYGKPGYQINPARITRMLIMAASPPQPVTLLIRGLRPF